ncbi:hypothetical protein [Nocardia vulneris]|uniref:hypothetical protein n=1 Tax=Nocardia vulneris TaxID=1141657 RepID=UPI0012E0B674|nr:hypothetical protein [Nocardia vulneris]
MTHEGWGAHKIGITSTNSSSDRLSVHRKYGWKLYRSRLFNLGADAYAVEQAVIKRIRGEFDLAQYLSAEEMPQGGATETVNSNEISLPEVWRLVGDEIAKMEMAPKF